MSALAYDVIELERGPVIPLLSRSLRAMFMAAPGYRLVGGDFSQIEARINAWLAGEDWKLDAYRAYDEGAGPDLYKLAYSRTFGVPIDEVTKAQRQIGKTEELAFGYQGSVGAWLRFDPNPELVTRLVREQMKDSGPWRFAEVQYDGTTNRYGLSRDQWVAIKVVVNGWRDSHPRIVQSWWDRGDATIEAVEYPGTVVPVMGNKVQYLAAEDFLWCRLPSGKLLAYCHPRLVERAERFLVDADGEIYPLDEFFPHEVEEKIAAGAEIIEERRRVQVAFEGKNQKTGAWGTQYLYGGMLCNNDVQGTARELLRVTMHAVEDHGYPIVMHTHDEIVSEVKQKFGSVDEFESLMSILPPWAKGLPLAAAAWEDARYIK